MRRKKLLYIGGAVALILVTGYFVAGEMVRKKLEEALQTLPPSVQLSYGSLHPDILGGMLVINDIRMASSPEKGLLRQLSIHRMTIRGIHYFALMRSRRNVSIGSLELTGVQGVEYKGDKKELSIEGDVILDSIHLADLDHPVDPGPPADLDHPADGIQFGAIRLQAKELYYAIPQAFEVVRLKNLRLDSKLSFLRADTMQLIPTVDKLELGGIRGHQVDWVEARTEGLAIEQLDVMALQKHALIAGGISIQQNYIHVFRDRRLPMQTDPKLPPMDYLKTLPLSVRVGQLKFGASTFVYEEFPKKGKKTGALRILRLHGTVKPLINRPVAGDPAYITVLTEGSLMGSGSVTATTRLPLHKGDPYLVEGAFHNLDVTSLNPSAENLGDIHLESGMLDELSFRFDMTEEKATGKIIGEYHHLVVDKLRGTDDKKTDKVKSFFLKKLIIPKDKDHTLPESKRTGKVNYKRDPARYFSYYMLHALLVGVKSSFSLGFLLPG